MKVELEIVQFSAADVVTASNTPPAACSNPGQLIDECDPEAE